MRNRLRWTVVVVVALSSLASYAQIFSFGGEKPATEFVPGEVLVRFRSGRSTSQKLTTHKRVQAAVKRQFAIVPDLQLVSVPARMSVEEAVAAYRSDPNVLYAEPNYIRYATQSPVMPNDPMFSKLWGLHNTGADGGKAGADVKAPEAWAISKGSANVVVAVIDSGIDYTHPDLAANIWSNSADCNTNGVDDDGNGYVDDCHGIDAFNHDSDPMDDHGHGTHVAGTIGATGDNGLGVVGVNWKSSIIACKFLSAQGYGMDSGAIECLNYLANLKERGVNIVATNNSWGGGANSTALSDAIARHRDLGILFIAAAGNRASDNDTVENYPSNYPLANIVAVAATTKADALAGFSNFGRRMVHIGAPGDSILSTIPDGQYGTKSGTSMATPHVTGAVALLAAAHPELDWIGLKNRIISSGDTVPALQKTITGRRLNVHSALTCSNSEVQALSWPLKQRVWASVGREVKFQALHINCEQPAGAINVSIEPGGLSLALADDGQGLDETAGDGMYTGGWLPSAPKVYTYALAGETGTVVVNPYTPTAVSMQWRDISGNGEGLKLQSGSFGGSGVPFQLPFPVSFAGLGLYQFQVSPNGMVTAPGYGSGSPQSPLPLYPSEVALLPFGEILYADGYENQRNVFWGVLGQEPNRELVLEWRDMPHSTCYAPDDGGVTFQVVFFESSTDVLYNYKDAVFGGRCATHDNGATANVGMQVNADAFVQYSYQQPSITDDTAILWKLHPDFPASPAPSLSQIMPPYFLASAYYGGAILTMKGSGFMDGTLFLSDGLPRLTFYGDASNGLFQLNGADFDHVHTMKASVFNALPGGGKSTPINYDIKQQDFTLELSPATIDLTGALSGFSSITVRPAPAVIDPIRFSCTTSDPKIACGFSSTEVFGGFEAPISTQLTVSRPSAIAAVASVAPKQRGAGSEGLPAVWISVAGFSVIGLVQVGGSRRRLAVLLSALVLLAAMQISCGGGNSAPPPPPPPTASLVASPASIHTGQSSTLSWSTSSATSVTLDGVNVAASGSQAVSPTSTKTYRLLASGSGGSKEATATVTVTNANTLTVTIKATAAGVERTATVNVLVPAS